MSAAPEISVVVPVYNEAESLAPLVRELHAALAPAGTPYEILLVDDGSTDASGRVMDGLAATDPRLRIVRRARNRGQSAAFAAGFRFARGGIIVTCDADLQNDPADIPALLELLKECDLACGVRARRRDRLVRRLASRVANAVRNGLTRETIADTGCSLKAFRAGVAKTLPLFDGMHRFFPTLARLQGARVRERPVNHRPRLHGAGKYGVWSRLWRTLPDLLAVRWLLSRRIDPAAAAEVLIEREEK